MHWVADVTGIFSGSSSLDGSCYGELRRETEKHCCVEGNFVTQKPTTQRTEMWTNRSCLKMESALAASKLVLPVPSWLGWLCVWREVRYSRSRKWDGIWDQELKNRSRDIPAFSLQWRWGEYLVTCFCWNYDHRADNSVTRTCLSPHLQCLSLREKKYTVRAPEGITGFCSWSS